MRKPSFYVRRQHFIPSALAETTLVRHIHFKPGITAQVRTIDLNLARKRQDWQWMLNPREGRVYLEFFWAKQTEGRVSRLQTLCTPDLTEITTPDCKTAAAAWQHRECTPPGKTVTWKTMNVFRAKGTNKRSYEAIPEILQLEQSITGFWRIVWRHSCFQLIINFVKHPWMGQWMALP